MAKVELKQVNKFFDDFHAVKDVNLEINDKEFVILVGPSGCGKSTTLRMIAGLEEISQGEIYIDGVLVNPIPPKSRDIAMVFQNYALYPHMSVYDNMSFGLKLRKYKKKEIAERVEEAADILGIGELLKRKPKELSGGQRQRVAVGRAIVRKPKVFLFDEPLSNLDAKMRVEMRSELSKLHTRLGATMIYVTHDQAEAMTMADRIVVMKDGVINQVDAPIPLYRKPANQFVASFIGTPPMNFIPGKIVKESTGLFFRADDSFKLKITPEMSSNLNSHVNQDVIFGVRPEDIYDKFFVTDKPTDTVLPARVDVIEPMGSEIYLYLQFGEKRIVARVSSNSQLSIDQNVEFVFDMSKIHIFDAKTKALLA